MKFKKPRNGHFTVYCFECLHWRYLYTRGCANIGVCNAVSDDITEQDAYDKPCGAFKKREKGCG